MSEDSLSDLEIDALELIRTDGPILQSELWKEVNCSTGKGSQIARKLAEKNLIERERVTRNGTSTYELQATRKNVQDLDFSLLMSGDLLPPFISDDDVDYDDDRFTQWILNLESEYAE